MKSKNVIILIVVVLIVIAISVNTFFIGTKLSKEESTSPIETYNPIINPEDFTIKLTNKYFSFKPDTTYIFEGETDEGIERTEVHLTKNTKSIMGVKVAEVRDKVYIDGDLAEDTRDWYAQDKEGNVWYFGESSKDFINGKLVSTSGSWVAGIYGAKPGIIMKGNPQPGDTYYQEYYPGEAEDKGSVVDLGLYVKVEYGSFSNCIQTKDWNPLDLEEEHKYYCPGVGLVYETEIDSAEGIQLIGITSSKAAVETETPIVELKKDTTESEAKAIAKKAVDGTITDIEIEKKFGKATYVVEMDDDGEEVDVRHPAN